jgi:hypothetical protein
VVPEALLQMALRELLIPEVVVVADLIILVVPVVPV